MTIADIIKKAMLAGLGAQEKAKEFFDELVKAGELSKSDAASLMKEWVAKAETGTKDLDVKVKDAVKDAVTGVLEKLNIPTRDDMDRLEQKIQQLSARVKKLEGGEGEA